MLWFSKSRSSASTGPVEQETKELISIAKHLEENHLGIENYKPGVLRSLVLNPSALRILPRPVLQRLLDDPLFSIQLQNEALARVSEVLKSKAGGDGEDVEGESEDFDYYDDYYDYTELENVGQAVGSFLSDLDPEFLRTVSPSLIISYIEGASAEDVKTILNNSTLLRNLPPETIGELLKKLPKDLIVQVVNSEGVEKLFNETASNLTSEEMENIVKFRDDLIPILIDSLDADILASLPEILIKSHASNQQVLTKLFQAPNKLKAVLNAFPSILRNISISTVVSIFEENPSAVDQIDDSVITTLIHAMPEAVVKLSADVLLRFTRNRPHLLEQISPSDLRNLASRMDVISELNDKDLISLMKNQPTILNLIAELPSRSLTDFLMMHPNLLDIVPKSAETHLHQLLSKDKFIRKLSSTHLASFAGHSKVQKALTRKTISRLLKVQPYLPLVVSDSAIRNLLKSRPYLVSIIKDFSPEVLLRFVSSQPSLLSLLPNSADPYIKDLLSDRKFLRLLPPSFLVQMAASKRIRNLMTKHSIIQLLDLHPTLPKDLPLDNILVFLKHLRDPWFRSKVPCSTISIISGDPKFVKAVPDSVLEAILTSRRMLTCIPAKNMARLLGNDLELSRLSLPGLVSSMRKLPKSKYSLELVRNFLLEQAPSIAFKVFKGRFSDHYHDG